jgi:hypothetical protein
MRDLPDFPTPDDAEQAPDRREIIDRILGGAPDPNPD